MNLKVIPVNMVAAPNSWAPTKDTFWSVTDAIAVDLWGLLTISDTLGIRPYVPIAGSVLSAVFQRGDYIGSTNSQNLTVNKTAVMNSDFRSLVKIPITSDEATKIISGTVVFTLAEGSSVKKWGQNWSVKKLNTSAGF
jgi:hypothetical protein